MKNLHSKISLIAIVFLLAPQIAFAAWWNPFTWNIFPWFQRPQTQKQFVVPSVPTATAPATTTTQKTSDHKKDMSPDVLIPAPKATVPASPVPAPIPSTPTISTSDLEIQRLKLQMEQLQKDSQAQKLQAQQLQDQQQRDALAKRQNCLNTHPTKAQIQQATDMAIATLNSSMTASKASITSQYDSQIAQVKAKLQNDLTSAEGGVGFAYNSAALTQMQNSANASIEDLESRKQELLLMADAGYGTKIADVRMRALKMLQESSEMECGI